MKRITDLSDTDRFAMREAIENAGGFVAMYQDECMLVAASRPFSDWYQKVRSAGFSIADSITYFPLGSDSPPDHLRHYGPGGPVAPRGDRPGYWLYSKVYPK